MEIILTIIWILLVIIILLFKLLSYIHKIHDRFFGINSEEPRFWTDNVWRGWLAFYSEFWYKAFLENQHKMISKK